MSKHQSYRKQIVELLNQGMRCIDISEQLNCNYCYVCEVKRKYKESIDDGKSFYGNPDSYKKNKILSIYKENPYLTNEEISKLTCCSNQYISKVLHPLRKIKILPINKFENIQKIKFKFYILNRKSSVYKSTHNNIKDIFNHYDNIDPFILSSFSFTNCNKQLKIVVKKDIVKLFVGPNLLGILHKNNFNLIVNVLKENQYYAGLFISEADNTLNIFIKDKYVIINNYKILRKKFLELV